MDDESVDAVISLASLRHSQQRDAFYREAHRVLKPGGKFLIGDVERGSPQDDFLNGFVNEYNSMSHEGDFLEAEIESARMSSAGFEVIHNDRHDYDWSFPDTSTMFEFCTGLFGLDQASPAALTKGLSNLRSENTPHIINWGLLMIMESKTKLANEGEVK